MQVHADIIGLGNAADIALLTHQSAAPTVQLRVECRRPEKQFKLIT